MRELTVRTHHKSDTEKVEYYSLDDSGCGCCSDNEYYFPGGKNARGYTPKLTMESLQDHIEWCHEQLALALKLREEMKNAET
jgi:hypothetical protein